MDIERKCPSIRKRSIFSGITSNLGEEFYNYRIVVKLRCSDRV